MTERLPHLLAPGCVHTLLPRRDSKDWLVATIFKFTGSFELCRQTLDIRYALAARGSSPHSLSFPVQPLQLRARESLSTGLPAPMLGAMEHGPGSP